MKYIQGKYDDAKISACFFGEDMISLTLLEPKEEEGRIFSESWLMAEAGVAEWQTRQTQNLLMAALCGFKSRRRQRK